jgi:hypothetical protein
VPGTVVDRPATVYRAAPEPEPMTHALPSNAAENSGSLTGFILSRGRLDLPGPRSRILLAGLVILLVVTLLSVLGLVAFATVLSRVLEG